MRKKLCVFLLLFSLIGIWSISGKDTYAATKEYTIKTNQNAYYLFEEGSVLGDEIDQIEKDSIYGVSSTNKKVAYFDTKEDYSLVIKGLGNCDVQFKACGMDETENTYIIHVNVYAKTGKTKKIRIMKGSEYDMFDFLNNIEYYNDYKDIHISKKMSDSSIAKLATVKYEGKKYYVVKGLKPGKTEFTYMVSDSYSGYIQRKVEIEVITVTATRKEAIKAAKTWLAKKSSKTSFTFADINFDGVKDIYTGRTIYKYSPSSKKFVKSEEEIAKLYIDTSKKRYMIEYTPDEIGARYNCITDKNGKVCFAARQINSNKYRLDKKTISKAKFNSLVKKYMPKKKEVKIYKNTSKNRKALIK